jgi:hypothetical protein
MAKKQSGFMLALQAERQRRDEEVRHHARVFQMDLVTIALGRMGFREKRFQEFDRVMQEVALEYCTGILEDAEGDKDLWYSKETIDREIRQYVGSMFVPYEERYK